MLPWDSRVAHGLANIYCEGSAQATTAYDLHGSQYDPGGKSLVCRPGSNTRPARTLLRKANGINRNVHGRLTSAAGRRDGVT
jgi:hypothetical protein